MKIRKILCPTDFSAFSQHANTYATEIAKGSGATIFFVHVTLPAAPYGAEHLYVAMDSISDEIREQFDQVTPTDPQVACEHHLLEGNPADAIVQFSKDHQMDLIVMGTHGRTGLSRLLMGSVAEEVVRGADCPVLAVKHPVVENGEDA